LAREILARRTGPFTRFDLEDPDDLAQLAEPKLALGALKGLVVLDEIQRRPEIFPVLRVLIDRPQGDARFLILGSASPELLRQSSESLAGRIAYHELDGLALDEVGLEHADELWLRGGFPRSFLASVREESLEWRVGFIRTFLERDLAQLGVQVPALTLHRFWRMLAHYHGQIWNGAELARAFGVADSTVRRYLDLLSGALVVRQLAPWHENIGKRQIKSPKVYIADTGILHALLGIGSMDDLLAHPKVGASWEGFVLHEIVRRLNVRPEE
jgi:predicted AAA+ superfamily ATPase